jgi:DNA-binding GntR family transcriptional regulator
MAQANNPEDDPRKYVRLAAGLRRQITDQTLRPGQPAPSITELAAGRGRARGTCAHALQMLQDEAFLIFVPGLGYHVAPRPGSTPEGGTR